LNRKVLGVNCVLAGDDRISYLNDRTEEGNLGHGIVGEPLGVHYRTGVERFPREAKSPSGPAESKQARLRKPGSQATRPVGEEKGIAKHKPPRDEGSPAAMERDQEIANWRPRRKVIQGGRIAPRKIKVQMSDE